MHKDDIKKYEALFQEISDCIADAIKTGFITDSVYEKLKADIVIFEGLDFNSKQNDPSSQQLLEIKNKIYLVYQILNKDHPKMDVDSIAKDNIVGDYFSDDNTFILSDKTKSELKTILNC